jgi:hypothetical protein
MCAPLKASATFCLRGMLVCSRKEQSGSHSNHKDLDPFMRSPRFDGADLYLSLRFSL